MPTSTAIQVKFSGRDFDTLSDDLLFRLKESWGDTYTDFSLSSLGMMLVDLMAYGSDQLSWNIDRKATECYLETALLDSTVYRLCRQIGYAMRPAASATADLDVAPETAQAFEWSIPVGFQFQGPNGLVFEVTQEITWSSGDASTKTVPVREGATKRLYAASDGTGSQQIKLAAASGEGKYLVHGTVRVFVDGVEWTESEFLTFEETDQFEVRYLDGPPVVLFGNGVAGNVPPSGAEIRIIFVVGSGASGNVAHDSITSAVRPLVCRFTTVALEVTNPAASSGGSAPETVEEARVTAPSYFGTRGVAVTTSDYETLAGTFVDAQYGRVAKATAYAARDLSGDGVANGLMSTVEAALDSLQATLDSNVAALKVQHDAIDAARVAGQDALSEITARLSDIEAQATSISGSVTTAQAQLYVAGLTSTAIDDVVNDPGGVYGFTLAGLAAVLAGHGEAAAAAAASAMSASLAASKAALDAAKTTADAAVSSIQTAGNTILADEDVATAEAAVLTTQFGDIGTAVTAAEVIRVTLDGAVEAQEIVIDAAFLALAAHLSEVLAADCSANVITVPILAKDGDGFYVAPTSGLIGRLQDYLRDRCDVAHSVQVVSGVAALVSASIEIELRVLDAYTYEEVASDIEAECKSLLKGREFGSSLYLHRLHKLVDGIDGVDVANILITGDPAYLDSSGNLIVDQEHVITYGSISISAMA